MNEINKSCEEPKLLKIVKIVENNSVIIIIIHANRI